MTVPKEYDDELERYMGEGRDRFRIYTPAGSWWPAYEHPGFLAWHTDGEPCPDVEEWLSTGIGWNDTHVMDADLRDHKTDKEYASERIDLSDRLTGDLERDAETVRDVVGRWLQANAEALGKLCGPRWVPKGEAAEAAIPAGGRWPARSQNVTELRERLERYP